MRSHRLAHYGILIVVTGLLTLPNLGAHSLWDMDEGVNAECTREMLESGTWVIPTFNWKLRTAKPVMLYWLQRPAFEAFGVSEWSARLPSVLLGLGTVLLTYELGRRMFGAATGLLGGIVLASAIQFCILSHAATPDAPLIFFTTLTFYLFWIGHENGGRTWFVPAAVASALAVLSKGPIGLALPGLVVLAYLLWHREWRRVFDLRLIWGILAFLAVAAPWYVLVTAETKGEWASKFFGNENFNRFTTPQEHHRGPIVYYIGALIVLFAPWSCFIGATFWYAVKSSRTQSPGTAIPGLSPETRANRFLLCWVLSYFVFFSIAATKLPNYIGPLYPALALLTAHFLVRWRVGEITPARWVIPVGIAGVALTGLLVGGGLLLASGTLSIPIKGMRLFPGLELWAWLGLIPLGAAAVMAWCLRAGNRPGVVRAVTLAAVALVALTAAGPVLVVDRYKAAKELVQESGTYQPAADIRLASLDYFQESLVFYAERQVKRSITVEVPGTRGRDGMPLKHERPITAQDAADFLMTPWPAYLFVPEAVWTSQVADKVAGCRIVARKYDFYRNADILVVTNLP
jgi:4-amino-4-deoxy-L-arabinose transferase-like glycosyltransferase